MKKKFIVSIYIQKNRVYMDAECKNDITDCLYEKLRLFGDANADALNTASVKLKDTFNDETEYYSLEDLAEDEEEQPDNGA